jgi:hypothetical protein
MDVDYWRISAFFLFITSILAKARIQRLSIYTFVGVYPVFARVHNPFWRMAEAADEDYSTYEVMYRVICVANVYRGISQTSFHPSPYKYTIHSGESQNPLGNFATINGIRPSMYSSNPIYPSLLLRRYFESVLPVYPETPV